MKILYHIPNPKGMGADRWIYQGWRNAFIDLGHEVYELTAFDDLQETVKKVKPDVFWTAWHFMNICKSTETLKQIRKDGAKIFMLVDWPPPGSIRQAEIVRDEEIADAYFGEREIDSMKPFMEFTGREYHVIANAADKCLHFPVAASDKYQYDIAYLGANLPMKKEMFRQILLPLKTKYNVGIFGPYWTVTDNMLRAAQKVFLKISLRNCADIVNNMRVSIPAEDENALYSSAKICLNFHERQPDGSQPHHIVNQRTFKIAACGGFQICDDVPALKQYFDEDEIVTAKANKPEEWFEKIAYYIQHEQERTKIRDKAVKKVLTHHTYHNRVEQVLNILFPERNFKASKDNLKQQTKDIKVC